MPGTTWPPTHLGGCAKTRFLRRLSAFCRTRLNERRINNINQHFVTAFLGVHLKGLDYGKYLALPETAGDTPWTGFKPRTSVGLEMRHAKP